MRIVLPVAVLFLPALAWAAEISSPQALACFDWSTHQSMRLSVRLGDGDGAEKEMRRALSSGACRRVPDRERVLIVERYGRYVRVQGRGVAAPGLWVEAADVAP